MNGIRCFLSVTRGRAAPPRRRGFARDVIVSVDGIPMQTVDSNGVHDLPWSHARGSACRSSSTAAASACR